MRHCQNHPRQKRSLREGAVEPLGKHRNNRLFLLLEMLGRRYDFTLDDPLQTFSEEALNAVIYGDAEPLTINLTEMGTPAAYSSTHGKGLPNTSIARKTTIRRAAAAGANNF